MISSGLMLSPLMLESTSEERNERIIIFTRCPLLTSVCSRYSLLLVSSSISKVDDRSIVSQNALLVCPAKHSAIGDGYNYTSGVQLLVSSSNIFAVIDLKIFSR